MNLLETTSTKKLNNDGITNGTPEGWTRCPLKKIALRITKGATPTSYGFMYQGEGIRFVKVENLNNGRIDHESIKHFISEEANLNQRRSVLLVGDILFSIAGTIGRTCLVREEDLPANTNQALAIIRGTSDILLPNFLQLQLQSQISSRQASNQARGGSMNNISLEDVGNIEIWVPPLTEQERIVAKLEKLLERVNLTKERLAKVSMILMRFHQAVLAAACSGRLTEDWRENNPHVTTSQDILNIKIKNIYKKHLKNLPKLNELKNDDLPNKWSYATLPYLVSNEKYSIKRGPFGSSLKKEYFVDKGYKVYEQQHVIRNDFTIGKYYIDEKKFYELKAFEINPGDLIISCSGTIGRIAIVPQEMEKGIINQALLKLKLDKDVILDKYFVYMFGDFVSKQEFLLNVKGIAITNIASVEELKQILFPTPPIDEQHEIVRRVEAMYKLAEAVEKRVAAASARTKKLTQAILSKAFRGELVPTEAELARREGRSYEPASELLARIKADRESGRESQRGHRPRAKEESN